MPEPTRPILADELTKDAYEQLARDRVFVLPFGILEEHGPHLPLGTDTFQVEAVVRDAAAATGAVVLPTVNYGQCTSTRPFPGSISIRFDTLRALVVDILDELARHGVRSVALVSGHAGSGHMAAMKLAARDALERHAGMALAVLSEWDILFGLDRAEAGLENVPAGDGHAGTMETARMLHLRPELVGEPPKAHASDEPPFLVEARPERWLPEGYVGDPTAASAGMGERLHTVCVEGLVALFETMRPK